MVREIDAISRRERPRVYLRSRHKPPAGVASEMDMGVDKERTRVIHSRVPGVWILVYQVRRKISNYPRGNDRSHAKGWLGRVRRVIFQNRKEDPDRAKTPRKPDQKLPLISRESSPMNRIQPVSRLESIPMRNAISLRGGFGLQTVSA